MHVVEQRHINLERQIGTMNTVVGQPRLILEPVEVQIGHRADGNDNVANRDFHILLQRTAGRPESAFAAP